MFFASDNASGIAPDLLAAMGAAAGGYAMPYGNDDLTRAVEARVREVFEAPEARVYLVATGTAANALALGCLCPPWGRVWCHEAAHIEQDECNAPEFYMGGAKLSLIRGAEAKIGADALAAALDAAQPGVVHSAQPGALSITQATELGATYTAAEIAALCDLAKGAGIPVHMDGTRFSNAVARMNARPADLTWRAGVDVLCLGATKCGAMAAEAVILFDPARAWEFELRRKRGGHLFSKMRFVAAQMLAWLEDGLWLRLAGHANAMADRLAAGLAAAGAGVLNPIDANMIFARITLAQHRRLQAAGARYYLWPKAQVPEGGGDAPVEIRLVTSFATTPEDVDRFLDALRG
ncbi:beta-eliminating lyase-related protein [Limibaculum sp. FT325]|uniref:threonine aldolase family protein n=1 Tax=Thermohalobaculum sediminis TaxID=2939436 RepID=UPI0020C16BD7|nr:beta-eliminating lyase-related protein [Limibaculum sediminis]MCL5777751.1 beta-eliminating lyase-related protein [Limibaculum sediminis]